MRKPDFFIVGAPKCGTSSMYKYLKAHPEIFMSESKEPHFFGKDIDFWGRDRLLGRTVTGPSGMDEYLALFSAARDEKRVGEASTSYLYSKSAPSEIKEFNPAASIVIMLRNPVDFLHSLHSQIFYSATEGIVDFEEALAAEDDRRMGLRVPKNARHPGHVLYREQASFSEQLERYFAIFGRDHVHVIIFDDLVRDPAATYRSVLRFLEVDPTFLPEFSVVNPNKRYRSWKLGHLIKKPPPPVRRMARTFLPRLEQRRGLTRTLMRLLVKQQPRPPMDPALRRRLQQELAPEVERLSGLLDRDLNYWSRD